MNKEKPLQIYRCPSCGGTGKIVKNYHAIIRETSKWVSRYPDVNDETCKTCRGTGKIEQ